MFSDEIKPELEIDEEPWNVISAKVVHSQTEKPNYAEIKCVPSPKLDESDIPEYLPELRSKPASLKCKTDLSQARETIAEENGAEFETDSLLFDGHVARIYPVGDKSVDVVLFDPGQSLFERSSVTSEDEDDQGQSGGTSNSPRGRSQSDSGGETDSAQGQSDGTSDSSTQKDQTSIQNKVIDLTNSQFTDQVEQEDAKGKITEVSAYYAVKYILDELGITDRDISGIEKENGTEYTIGEETYKGGYDIPISFPDPTGTAIELLDEIANKTKSTHWFDKRGTFNFGPPQISEYNIRYITDSTAGITTPPYQSVKVIGTGVASEEGYPAKNQLAEERIVKKVALENVDQSKGGYSTREGALRDPKYTYKSADLVTDQQVEFVANKLINKIGEQQKTGEITMVGFPEVTLDDVLVMPDSDSQPMGGEDYAVTKITHRINNGDGFITKVQVSAPFVETLFYDEPQDYRNFKPTTILEQKGETSLGLQKTEDVGFIEGLTQDFNDIIDPYENSVDIGLSEDNILTKDVSELTEDYDDLVDTILLNDENESNEEE